MSSNGQHIPFRIRAKETAFNQVLFDERGTGLTLEAASLRMGDLWNELFCWREGFQLQLLALQGAPRRWMLRERSDNGQQRTRM